jgi:hypothetical protein
MKSPTTKVKKARSTAVAKKESLAPVLSIVRDDRIARPSHDEIAHRAYEIWQETGCLNGYAELHWLQAEHELLDR